VAKGRFVVNAVNGEDIGVLKKSRHLPESVVSLSNVSLIIDGRERIHDLTWEIRKGENWVLVGSNGAGKTTLLRLLNGYHWPSSGTATVLGESFGRVDLREIRRKIGLVSSYISDWIPENEKVLDVVLSGKHASLGLWNAAPSSDKKYATLLLRRLECEQYRDSKFGRLSQGEKQRVVIARALMAKPRLLVLDEPCAGLDIPGREKFLSTLGRIARKKRKNLSILYVTHRIEEIPPGFTNAILLKNGRMVKKGELDDVLNDDNLTACFGVKIKVREWRNRYYALVDS
jgi:iron complex transport system ATP-binding protein